MPVHNAEIATLFDQAAELLEIKGDNPFRIRAYRRAARVVEGLPKSVAALRGGWRGSRGACPASARISRGKIAEIAADRQNSSCWRA